MLEFVRLWSDLKKLNSWKLKRGGGGRCPTAPKPMTPVEVWLLESS